MMCKLSLSSQSTQTAHVSMGIKLELSNIVVNFSDVWNGMTSFVNWNAVTSAVDDLTLGFSAGHMSVLKRWFKDKSLWSVCFDFSSYFQSLTMAFQRSTLTTSGEFSETELKHLLSWSPIKTAIRWNFTGPGFLGTKITALTLILAFFNLSLVTLLPLLSKIGCQFQNWL
jgi:hypothetical protein